jgi:hypothetical protein
MKLLSVFVCLLGVAGIQAESAQAKAAKTKMAPVKVNALKAKYAAGAEIFKNVELEIIFGKTVDWYTPGVVELIQYLEFVYHDSSQSDLSIAVKNAVKAHPQEKYALQITFKSDVDYGLVARPLVTMGKLPFRGEDVPLVFVNDSLSGGPEFASAVSLLFDSAVTTVEGMAKSKSKTETADQYKNKYNKKEK